MAQKTVSNDGPRIDSSGGNGIPRRLIIDVLLLLSREWKEEDRLGQKTDLPEKVPGLSSAHEGNNNKREIRLYDRLQDKTESVKKITFETLQWMLSF